MGALVAFRLQEGTKIEMRQPFAEALGALGLLLIGWAVLVFDRGTSYLSLYALVPTVGTALVILFATGQTRTLVLAWFSWKFVETPFRSRQRFTRRQIFTFSIACSLLFAAIGSIGHHYRGFTQRMPQILSNPDIALPTTDNGWCFYSIDSAAGLPIGAKGVECWLGDKAARKKGVLFGDSYAGQYEPLWDMVGRNAGWGIHAVTTNWCNPSNDESFVGEASSRSRPQRMFNRQYLRENISKYDFAVFAGNWGAVLHQGEMNGVLGMIGLAASSTPLVVVMAAPRQFDADVMMYYKKSLLHGKAFDIARISSTRDEQALKAERLLESESGKYRNVLYLDRETLYGSEGLKSSLTVRSNSSKSSGLKSRLWSCPCAPVA